jgi:hypothetical protein
MKATRRFFSSALPFPLLLLLNLLLLALLSLLPSASPSSAFDENEASWTRGRWETAPFKLPLPFMVLGGGEGEGREEIAGEGAGAGAAEKRQQRGRGGEEEAGARSPSRPLPPPPSPPSSLPASSLLGPLSPSSLARRIVARDEALAGDEWQLDESDASQAAEALGCDACRAAVARGWELGAGWVALQGRAEAKRKHPVAAAAPALPPGVAAASNAAAAAAAATAAAASLPLQQQQQQQPETVFLLPAQLRQRLRRGLRAWCEREGEQGTVAEGRSQISPGSALEGAALVREQQGGRWRRVERPPPAAAAGAAAETKAAATPQPTSARERLAARLSCSRLLFSPSSPSSAAAAAASAATMPPGVKEAAPPPDPPVVAALADGLSLFASALSRAANSAEAASSSSSSSSSDDKDRPPRPRLLPPTLLPGRRPDETGRLCADYHPECAGWASLGECEANPGYMVGDDGGALPSDSPDAAAAAAASSDPSSDRGSSASSSGSGSDRDKSSSGSGSSSAATASSKRRRPGFCRFSCGVCSPLPRGFPSSSPSSPSASAILAAVARLPPNSHEAAQLEAEALAIKEGVLLRACYAAKPCGGRGGGEKRFGRWFGGDDEEEGEEEGKEKVGGGGNNNASPPLSSPAAASAASAASPLHGRCFVSAAGWWLYEVCVGGGIRQFHPPTSPRDAPAANSLGAFSNASSPGAPPPPSRREVRWLSSAELYRGAPVREEAVDRDSRVFPFVEQRYEGGDPCGGESESGREGGEQAAAAAVRRSATLRLVCPSHPLARDVDAVPRLLIAEPRTCSYVVTLFHPEACALVDGNRGAAAAAAAAAAAKKVEEGAVSATETKATETENVAAAAVPPEAAAEAAPDHPLPSPAVPLPSPADPPPHAPAAAAHDEL